VLRGYRTVAYSLPGNYSATLSLYALPAWGLFLSVDLKQKIDGFLKRSYCYGFTKNIPYSDYN